MTFVINLRKDELINHLRHQIEELQIELVKCKSEVFSCLLSIAISLSVITNSLFNVISICSWNLKEADWVNRLLR